jgi:ankyrin repeat protein
VEVTQLLLDGGADANEAKIEIGSTPLLMAAQEGRAEVMQLLLTAGRMRTKRRPTTVPCRCTWKRKRGVGGGAVFAQPRSGSEPGDQRCRSHATAQCRGAWPPGGRAMLDCRQSRCERCKEGGGRLQATGPLPRRLGTDTTTSPLFFSRATPSRRRARVPYPARQREPRRSERSADPSDDSDGGQPWPLYCP